MSDSPAQTFTIRNSGDSALTMADVSIVGENAGDFTVDTAGTLATLPATTGATTFTVAFQPRGTGFRTATLRVFSDDADKGTLDIVLTGTGASLPAVDDTAFTTGTKAIDLDLLANDPGVNRSEAVITFPTQPRRGTVRLVGEKVRYIPSGALALAGDTFTYHYDDGRGGTGTGTVKIGNFASIGGQYDGLIVADPSGTGEERHRESGHLRVSLSRTGAFTGTLTFAGTTLSPTGRSGPRRYVFTDRLDSAGDSVRTIQHRTTTHRTAREIPPLTLALHFDAAAQTFTGTVASAESITPFTSTLTLEKCTHLPAAAGKYSVQIQPGDAPDAPDGSGAARIKIARTGSVIIAGRLADGVPFSSGAFLHADRAFPLYAALYPGLTANRGSLRGMIPLPGQTARPGPATLDWFKPVRPLDRLFPAGFTTTAHPLFIE